VLQGALSLALTTVFLASKRNLSPILVFILFLLWLLGMLLSSSPKYVIVLARALSLGNPCGWLNALYLDGWVRGDSRAFWNLAPVLAVLTTLPFSLPQVRRLHHQGAFRRVPVTRRDPFLHGNEASPPTPASPDDQRRLISSGDFLRPLPWHQSGLVGRLIAHALKPDEKLVAEALLPAGPPWSRFFLGFMVYLFLYLAAGTLIRFESFDELLASIVALRSGEGVSLLAAVAGGLFIVMLGLSVFRLFSCFEPLEGRHGTRSAAAANYRTFRLCPVNFWDVARTVAKTNSLLILLLLPPALVFTFTPLFRMIDQQAGRNLLIIPKLLTILWGASLMLQPMLLNPAVAWSGKSWLSALIKLAAMAVLYVLGTGMFSLTPVPGAMVWAAFVLVVLAWFFASAARYRHGATR
jgi:hypothetical protein